MDCITRTMIDIFNDIKKKITKSHEALFGLGFERGFWVNEWREIEK